MFSFKKIKFIFLLHTPLLFAQIKLDINTIPDEVDIYLNDIKLGKSQFEMNIIPGAHVFEIKKKGYAPLKYDLIVNPSKAVEIDFFKSNT